MARGTQPRPVVAEAAEAAHLEIGKDSAMLCGEGKALQDEAVSWQPQPACGELRWPEGSHGASRPAELLRLPAGPPSPCHRLAHLPSGQAMAQACGPWLLPSQTERKAGNCFCRRKQNVLGGRVGASPGSRQLPTRLRLPLGWGGRCQPSLRPALAPLWALIYSGAGRRGCLIPCPPLRCREEELPLVLDAREA